MKIENLTYSIDSYKIYIRYNSDKGHVVSEWDKKEFQSRVDSMGWRKWEMEIVEAGKVKGKNYGLMSWDEYYDFLTMIDIELFILTFENIRRRNAKDANGDNKS